MFIHVPVSPEMDGTFYGTNHPQMGASWHRLHRFPAPSFMRHVLATEKYAEVQIGAATALGNRQDLVPNMGIPSNCS